MRDDVEAIVREMLAERGRFPSGGPVPFDVAAELIAQAPQSADEVRTEEWRDIERRPLPAPPSRSGGGDGEADQ